VRDLQVSAHGPPPSSPPLLHSPAPVRRPVACRPTPSSRSPTPRARGCTPRTGSASWS